MENLSEQVMNIDYAELERREYALLAQFEAEYAERWPDHCRDCGGNGYTITYESHGDRWHMPEMISRPVYLSR